MHIQRRDKRARVCDSSQRRKKFRGQRSWTKVDRANRRGLVVEGRRRFRVGG